MPYSNRVFKPDFEAPNVKLPDWAQMGDGDSAPDIGGFVQALKKRITPATKGVEGGFTLPSSGATIGHEAGHTAPDMTKSKFGGSGGASL
jgi:hypothetical protein